MKQVQLTETQVYAATTINKNILVEAGAGSGKTAVLTERYLYSLKRGMSHHEVVAITFTEKAADEMRHRIIERYELPEDEIWVSTIHSFCARLLRNHPLEAELDPIFDIIEESTAEIRRESVLKSYFKYQLDNPTAEFKKLLGLFGFNYLQEIVLQGLRVRSDLKPARELPIYSTILNWVLSDPLWIKSVSLLESVKVEFVDKIEERRINILRIIAGLNNEPEILPSLLPNLSIQHASKNWPVLELEKVKMGFSIMKSLLKKVQPLMEWEDEVDAEEVEKLNRCIVNIILDARESYTREKSSRGELDFEDLLHKANWLLTDPAINEIYRNKFKQIMVDEFQDTNRLQYDILKKLTADSDGNFLPGRLFVVGDPKQSIYRFRGGEVGLFNDIKEEIIKSGGELINLSDNFRSSPAIINSVNNVFQLMFSGDRNPIQFVPLESKSSANGPEPAILMVPKSDGERRKIQSTVVQNYISQLISEGVNPQDIAILFRGTLQISPFEQALRKAGIPCYSYNSAGLFHQVEVYDLLNLLHFIEDKNDITSLVGILRSPVVGLTDESITRVIFPSDDESFDNVGISEDERTSLTNFYNIVEDLRGIKDRVPLHQFLHQVVEKTFLDLIQNSAESRDYIFQIIKLSEVLSNSVTTLRQFLDQVEFMISKGIEKSAGQITESSEAVQLMTVHKAKGLEFPYVIIPDLPYLPKPFLSRINCNYSGLVASSIFKNNEKQICKSWVYSWSRFLEKEEDIAESKRLLYVSMTRAISNLIFIVDEEDISEEDDPAILRKPSWMGWLNNPTIKSLFRSVKYDTIPVAPLPSAIRLELSSDVESVSSDWKPISESKLAIAESDVTISVTEMSAYKTCPLAHHYRHREDILITEGAESSRRAGYGSDIGRWTHKILNEWYPFEDDPKKITEKLEIPAEIRPRVMKLASAITHPNIRPLFPLNLDAKKELSFHIKLENDIVEGVIDIALSKDDGWHIIDYKTNRLAKNSLDHLASEYKFQLESYAAGLEIISGKPVKDLTLLFLDGPFKIEIPWNPQVKSAILNDWRNILSKIKKSAIDPNISSCPFCIFKKWCPEANLAGNIEESDDSGYRQEDETE